MCACGSSRRGVVLGGINTGSGSEKLGGLRIVVVVVVGLYGRIGIVGLLWIWIGGSNRS